MIWSDLSKEFLRRILIVSLFLPLAGCALTAPLLKAVERGRSDEVNSILDSGADVNAIYPYHLYGNWTPLLVAACENDTRMAQLLLNRGADPDAHLEKLWGRPLFYAAAQGNLEMVQMLLDAGADPTATDRRGKTVAMRVKEAAGDLDIVELLEEAEKKGKRREERRARDQAAEAELKAKLPEILAAEKAGNQAREAGRQQEALSYYVSALQLAPRGTEPDGRLRRKVIKHVLSIRSEPAIPEEAKRHAIRGQAILKKAKDAEEFAKALNEFEQALQLAPWWGDAYFNLGLVQEKVGEYRGAMQNLGLYLLAKPDASDAEAVKRKIIEIELQAEESEASQP